MFAPHKFFPSWSWATTWPPGAFDDPQLKRCRTQPTRLRGCRAINGDATIASNLNKRADGSVDSTPAHSQGIRQQTAKAVKVFSYACKIAYPEEAAHVEHQLTLTHRHRNLLTETLLKGREKYREIIKEHLGLDIKALEEQAEEITTEIKAVQQEISDWKNQNRTTKIQPDLSARLWYLRTERKPIFEKIKAVKKAAKEDPSIKPLIEQANGSRRGHKRGPQPLQPTTGALLPTISRARGRQPARFQGWTQNFIVGAVKAASPFNSKGA
jgi:hypothetical protein